MNIVIDEAAEVFVNDAKPRRELGEDPTLYVEKSTHISCFAGRILLKGDNITLIQQAV